MVRRRCGYPHPTLSRPVRTCVSQTSQRQLGATDSPIEDELEDAFTRMVDEGTQRLHRSWREVLVTGWPARGGARRRLKRAVGHALEFRTWQSLVRRQGCSAREAVEMMVALAEATSQN